MDRHTAESLASRRNGFRSVDTEMIMQEMIQNELARNAVLAVLILLAIFLMVALGQRLITRYGDDPKRIFRASRTLRRLGAFIGLVSVVVLFSPGVSEILMLLTVIGAGLAIALREAILSIVGWMRITVLSSYRDGDRIEINGVIGDVIDIRMMRTTLMEIGGWVDADQSTGRLVHIPNSWVFQHALYNYTRSFNFIWNELPITVSFRSDWRAARGIMLGFADESAAIVAQQAKKQIHEMSREFLIQFSILTPFVYVRVVENGVRLTLRYLCEVRKRRGSEHALMLSILDAFKEHGNIEFAYPAVHVATARTPQFGGGGREEAPPDTLEMT